ncbi:MAG: NUDIX domain-containing protein [Candidatus Levybacteria bacterium]|nr:NUDIX domain-containing protein [Candidatus Levybacteria bacterium]
MKFEFSSGGVVIKKSGQKTEVLLCQHSQHHGWVFPKGLIGDTPLRSSSSAGQAKKEKKEEAAVREVKEECGVDAEIVKQLTPVTYWYQWEGEKRRKTVYYFLMDFIGGDITKHDEEMENVEWLPLDEVENRLTYPSDKKVWQVALRAINRQPSAGHPKGDRLKTSDA